MWNTLSTATKILRARLAHINRVDIHVLDREVAEAPTDLNRHPGHIFCYFSQRKSGLPYLLVFGRQDPAKDISHIFCFYVNTKFRIIQKAERIWFEKKLQKGARLGLEIKLGVVKVATDLPQPLHMSVLVQMGEFLLDKDLMDNFLPEREMPKCTLGSMVCFNPTIPFPPCRIMEIDSDSRRVWDRIYDGRVVIAELDFHKPPSSIHKHFDVLKLYFHGHIIYGIRYKFYSILMLILTHPSMFQCEEDAQDVTTIIRQVLASSKVQVNYIGATRFYGRANPECNSDCVLKSILLALDLPLVTIKQCDVNFVLPDDEAESIVEEVLSAHCSQEAGPSVPYPPGWSDDEEILPNLPESGQEITHSFDSFTIPLEIDHSTCEPVATSSSTIINADELSCGSFAATCSQSSSQGTIVLSQSYIDNQLAERRQARDLKTVLKLDHPSLDIIPIDDPHNRILTNVQFFKRQLNHIVANFGLPATLLPLVGPPDLVASLEEHQSHSNRMLLVPMQSPVGLVIVIIDKEMEEWGLINPNIVTQRDLTIFGRLKSLLSADSCSFADYQARQIDIPCHIHKRYRLMHLLLSVYCICQKYGQAKMLPMRLTYTEKCLRLFCYKVCKELQEANQAHNTERGLVRGNNYLMPGAFRSFPAALRFEQAVSSTHECVFCGMRGFANMGSHVSMAHNGQAVAKRERRRWMDNRRAAL